MHGLQKHLPDCFKSGLLRVIERLVGTMLRGAETGKITRKVSIKFEILVSNNSIMSS